MSARSWTSEATHLLELAPSISEQEQLLSGLEEVEQFCRTESRLIDRLNDPTIPLDTRIQSLHAVLPQLSTHALTALELLMRDQQLADLGAFIQACIRIRAERQWGRDLEVTSAIPLTAEDQGRLRALAETKWKVPIRVKVSYDPAILGGLKFATEGWELDATIHGRLHALAHHLQTSTV